MADTPVFSIHFEPGPRRSWGRGGWFQLAEAYVTPWESEPCVTLDCYSARQPGETRPPRIVLHFTNMRELQAVIEALTTALTLTKEATS